MHAISLLIIFVVGCGNVTAKTPPPDRITPSQDIAAAAGTLSGGTWTLEAHLGGAVVQVPASAGKWQLKTASPTNP
jgi:hypothetical protein